MGVVQEPVNGRSRKGLGHELVEPGRVQVRRHSDGAFLVGGIDEAIETLGGVGPDFEKPMSSITIKSARRIRATTRLTESSER